MKTYYYEYRSAQDKLVGGYLESINKFEARRSVEEMMSDEMVTTPLLQLHEVTEDQVKRGVVTRTERIVAVLILLLLWSLAWTGLILVILKFTK